MGFGMNKDNHEEKKLFNILTYTYLAFYLAALLLMIVNVVFGKSFLFYLALVFLIVGIFIDIASNFIN
ncbi:conserved protein of unknown function [Oenococcus oeni]|nr:hypothetical protein [Oenococcus oeni]SYV98712.1 conserved hypothetical protein [Oenococcus oeni]SYW01650.1 conserved hypothetical protein [Oenococcus oeni]SYW02414.1 conserved hypothetical protein [Oenococcus oeni]SYW17954.1 conserved hypothetical protein [Oenococcus oeni]SYW19827.1 conserved hypothetical protein [Oenococcus oeni]